MASLDAAETLSRKVGRTNSSIYAVAKAGMIHYTRCRGDQLSPYDIAVNCIAPGDTRTGRFLGARAVDQSRIAGPHGAFVSGHVLRVDSGGQCWPD